MTIVLLALSGLCFGSLVNLLVSWAHQPAPETVKATPSAKRQAHAGRGRAHTLCPVCQHVASATDLIPVVSWLRQGGRCRYCGEPFPVHYPLVELGAAGLVVASALLWPGQLGANTVPAPSLHPFRGSSGESQALFILWLALLLGLLAVAVSDRRWHRLPRRLINPLAALAAVYALLTIATAAAPLTAAANTVAAVAFGGGIFYVLFHVSAGKYMGSNDVTLGGIIGLVLGTPGRSLLFILIAALLGNLVSLPLLASHRLKRTSTVPLVPFLVASAIVVQLFGASLLHWYRTTLLGF